MKPFYRQFNDIHKMCTSTKQVPVSAVKGGDYSWYSTVHAQCTVCTSTHIMYSVYNYNVHVCTLHVSYKSNLYVHSALFRIHATCQYIPALLDPSLKLLWQDEPHQCAVCRLLQFPHPLQGTPLPLPRIDQT